MANASDDVNDQPVLAEENHQAVRDRITFKRKVSKQLCWNDDYFKECVSVRDFNLNLLGIHYMYI